MQRELLFRNLPSSSFPGTQTFVCKELLRWLALPLLALVLLACERSGEVVAESRYREALVGDWQGTLGKERAIMSFTQDGRFTAQLLRKGFIGRTLGQREPGTIEGTWTLQGNTINLTIVNSDNVKPVNLATTSEIVSFKENELIVRSTDGETSTFIRAI